MKMSIIIPTHGRVDLFKETLKSVINQTSKEFEVIVTDDSSKQEERDEIKNLVQAAQKEGLDVKYIFTQPNLLQSKNTNQGLENASGQYLRILHSDDILAPLCIETEIKAFEENPDCYFLNHTAKSFYNSYKYDSNKNINIIKYNIFDKWLSGDIFTGCVLPTALAFRREVYQKVGGMNEEYKFLSDWEFFFRIILNEYLSSRQNAMYISGQLTGWRQHKCSITSTMGLTHFCEHIKFIDYIAQIYKKHNILSPEALEYALEKATEYRYERVIADYKKFRNFELPEIPARYSHSRKKLKIYSKKLKKHINIFLRPLKITLRWLIQPFIIIFYLYKLIAKLICICIKKEGL